MFSTLLGLVFGGQSKLVRLYNPADHGQIPSPVPQIPVQVPFRRSAYGATT